jgi:hypothetical protein
VFGFYADFLMSMDLPSSYDAITRYLDENSIAPTALSGTRYAKGEPA